MGDVGGDVASARRFSSRWNPLGFVQEKLWWRRAARTQADLPSRDARELRKARTAAGMSLEGLAEASGIGIDRVRGAENMKSPLELIGSEWLRLAVALDGRTWDEFQQTNAGRVGVGVYARGQMLKNARSFMRELSSDDLRTEDT
jgi:transcriptional regulator with XRE-family HTH domain